MRIALTLVLALAATPLACEAADAVFCGRSLGHHHIKGVEVPCPENAICLNVWFRWQLQIDRVLEGPEIGGRVSAAVVQHGHFLPSYEKSLQVFVIRRIDDEAKRQLLGADFQLVSHSPGDDAKRLACKDPTAH